MSLALNLHNNMRNCNFSPDILISPKMEKIHKLVAESQWYSIIFRGGWIGFDPI